MLLFPGNIYSSIQYWRHWKFIFYESVFEVSLEPAEAVSELKFINFVKLEEIRED